MASSTDYALKIESELRKPEADRNDRLLQYWQQKEQLEREKEREQLEREQLEREKEKGQLTELLLREMASSNPNSSIVDYLKGRIEGKNKFR